MTIIQIKKEFKEDYVSREAGERLRQMIDKICKKSGKVELDFSGVTIASTSFFDEGLAKLSDLGWTKNQFVERVIIKNINKFDLQVLNDLLKYRHLK